MKMPNFDFTLLCKEHNHENLFVINKLSNFQIIQLASYLACTDLDVKLAS